MENPTEQKIYDILTKLSEALDVPIVFAQDQDHQNKVIPVFDVNGIFSKLVALCVFSGMNVPSTFGPGYNRVHADVEFFKRKFEADPAKAAMKVPEEPPKEKADGVSESQ